VECLRAWAAAWVAAWAAWITNRILTMNRKQPGFERSPAVLLMRREIIGYRFIKNRRTGQRAGPLTPVFKDDWPYKVPAAQHRIWRYLDLWKFEHMLEHSSLYFRRADKLSDTGEGRLSAEGIRGTSLSDVAFRSAYKIADQAHAIDVAAHENTRGCMFINCWNVDEVESARMWAEYTTHSESVAICTTFGQLLTAVPSEELIISRVKYIDDATARCEFSHTTPFFYKDKRRFSFENELRLVRPLRTGEQVLLEDEKDFGKLIRVDITRLIDRIVANKNMPEPVIDRLRHIVGKYCRDVKVLRSGIEPRILDRVRNAVTES
jgi:hypothetical protein